MKNELQIFNYQNNPVRTIQMNGEPWFVLKDVCSILSIGNAADVYTRLDEDEKGVGQIDTLGGKQKMNIISESGLYNVILRSDKPEAKPFRKWVTSEVLPSIRKHGVYATPDKLAEMLLTPDVMIQTLQALKAEQEQRKALEAQAKVDKPKALYHDEVLNKPGLLTISTIAKDAGLRSGTALNSLLHSHGVLVRTEKGVWGPSAEYEWLIAEEYADYSISNVSNSKPLLKWTEKGRKWILFNRANAGKWKKMDA